MQTKVKSRKITKKTQCEIKYLLLSHNETA